MIVIAVNNKQKTFYVLSPLIACLLFIEVIVIEIYWQIRGFANLCIILLNDFNTNSLQHSFTNCANE